MIKSFAFIGLAITQIMVADYAGQMVPDVVYDRQARYFGKPNQRQKRKRARQVPQRRK